MENTDSRQILNNYKSARNMSLYANSFYTSAHEIKSNLTDIQYISIVLS